MFVAHTVASRPVMKLSCVGCCLQVFDLRDGHQVDSFRAASDTINGVDFSPCLNLLLTASGHRRYSLLLDGDIITGDEAQPGIIGDPSMAASSSRKRTLQEADARRVEPGLAGEEASSHLPAAGDGGGGERGGDASGDAVDSLWGLSMSSLQPGGLSNSLKLWQLHAEWLMSG
jgi:hypothetical protein